MQTPMARRAVTDFRAKPKAPNASKTNAVTSCAAMKRALYAAAPMAGTPRTMPATTAHPQKPPSHMYGSLFSISIDSSTKARLMAVMIPRTMTPPVNETTVARSAVPTYACIVALTQACTGKMHPAARAAMQQSTMMYHGPLTSIESIVRPVPNASSTIHKIRSGVGRWRLSISRPKLSANRLVVSWPKVEQSWNVAKPRGFESRIAATT
mmetsp:Transcript_15901/g.31062  ORF Transcript_15901/g.31062 Transcript_15901/m.31062 type:complete len:210 (+) Transcript_15901:361-990(+)